MLMLSAAPSSLPASSNASKEQIRKVAQEFEAVFSGIMIKAMRNTVGESSLIPNSFGKGVYTEMLDGKYSKQMASRGTVGLAGMIERELERQQGTGQDQSSGAAALRTLHATASSLPTDPSLAPNSISIVTPADNAQEPAADPASLLSRWKSMVEQVSKEQGVDSSLVSAVIMQESGGNPRAVSPKGAKGLMQLMDHTAAAMGVSSPFSPIDNLRGGTKYLRSLLDKFNGNERLALASYNAGPTAVQYYGNVPPYRETEQYVDAVLQLKQRFANGAGEGKSAGLQRHSKISRPFSRKRPPPTELLLDAAQKMNATGTGTGPRRGPRAERRGSSENSRLHRAN